MNLKEIRNTGFYKRLSDSIVVDNFDAVEHFVNLDFPDAILYTEVVKRWKDSRHDPDMQQRRYRIIKPFWFKSIDELKAAKPEIIKLCKENNARAYVYVNPRNQVHINSYADRLLKSGRRLKHNRYLVASREPWDTPNRKFCMVDVDSVKSYIHEHVLKVLDENNINIVYKYASPSGGLHILTDDKRVLKIDWSQFGYGSGQYAIVDAQPDIPAILYADLPTTIDYSFYNKRRSLMAGTRGDPSAKRLGMEESDEPLDARDLDNEVRSIQDALNSRTRYW